MTTDRRSEEGITIGLIDSIISIAHVLRDRDLNHPDIVEALKDLREDNDVWRLLDGYNLDCTYQKDT